MEHYSESTSTAFFLSTTIEYAQLQVGTITPFLTLPFKRYGFLLSECWIKRVWRFLSDCKFKLSLYNQTIPIKRRERDDDIMTTFISHAITSKPDLISLNRVRYFYGLILLLDISSLCGKHIILDSADNYTPNNYQWKEERPTSKDFSLWYSSLKAIFSPTYTWMTDLGKWTSSDYLPFKWHWDSSSNKIFRKDKTEWTMFVFDPITSIYSSLSNSSQIPLYSHYCEITKQTQGTLRLRNHITHSQFFSIPKSVSTNMMTRNTQWVLQHCEFYKDANQIVQFFISGNARVVADVSFSPHLTVAVGSAYWRAESTDDQVLFTGACRTTGSSSNPYRAELTGLYADS